MTRLRVSALAAAVIILAVLAQAAVPTWPGFHTWQFAVALAVSTASLVRYILWACKSGMAQRQGRLGVALIGALLIGVAGLSSGLLGPDTITIVRGPGTVQPLPDLGVAAFFPNVDAKAIASGRTAAVLRWRNGASVTMEGGARRFIGSYALEVQPKVAVYIEAYDAPGNRLTVTQPAGSAFLSPLLLFSSTVRIEGRTVPSDAFAVPAAQRKVEAMYFSSEVVRATRMRDRVGDQAATLFVVNDNSGRLVANGIGLGSTGQEVAIGGLRIRPTIGSYPALTLSSIPSLGAIQLGGIWLGVGLLWALGRFPGKVKRVNGLNQ